LSLNKIDFEITPYDFLLVADKDLIEDDFESSEQEFTDYFHRDGWQDILEKIVKMYVLKLDGKVMGYVTLAMAHIRHDATAEIKAKEINGTIPALLISHLAVHKDHQRRHIGQTMLKEIFGYIVPEITKRAGCRYVMLNPRDDQGVRDFYIAYGFDYYDKFLADGKSDKTSDAFLYDLKKNEDSMK